MEPDEAVLLLYGEFREALVLSPVGERVGRDAGWYRRSMLFFTFHKPDLRIGSQLSYCNITIPGFQYDLSFAT